MAKSDRLKKDPIKDIIDDNPRLRDRWKDRRQSSNFLDATTPEGKAKQTKSNLDNHQKRSTRMRDKSPLDYHADVYTLKKNVDKNDERDASPEKVGQEVKNKKLDSKPSRMKKDYDSDKQPAVRMTETSTKMPVNRGTSKKAGRLNSQVTPGKWETIEGKK